MKDALLDYIFDNCDAAYISDLRQKMIFQEYADMILEIYRLLSFYGADEGN